MLGRLTLLFVLPIFCAWPVWADEPFLAAHVSGLGGAIKREWAVGAHVFYDLAHKGFRLTLGLPLRFHPGTGLRMRDWDETTDYGRVIRELSLSDQSRSFLLRIAPLAWYSLGTGNIVSTFHSTLDQDHWRTGLVLSWHGTSGGLDGFVDSILDPEVLGVRLCVKPLAFLNPNGFFGRLELGGTIAGDIAAPKSYVIRNRRIALDSSGLPLVARESVSASGLDIRWPMIRSTKVEVVPYFAVGSAGKGSGLHAGLALDIRPSGAFKIGIQGDFRWLGAGYVAPYFDALYMVERYQFDDNPKASMQDPPSRRFGFGSGLHIVVKNILTIFSVLDLDSDGRFTTLKVWSELFLSNRVRITTGLAARGMPEFLRLFYPNKVVFSSALDLVLSKFFTAFVCYSREPTVIEGDRGFANYGSSDTVLAGLRFSFGNR